MQSHRNVCSLATSVLPFVSSCSAPALGDGLSYLFLCTANLGGKPDMGKMTARPDLLSIFIHQIAEASRDSPVPHSKELAPSFSPGNGHWYVCGRSNDISLDF